MVLLIYAESNCSNGWACDKFMLGSVGEIIFWNMWISII